MHHWRPSNGHVPPPELFEADARWYRHSLQLQRDAMGVVINWNPLAQAMDHLDDWVGVVLPNVPPGYVMGAYIDVCGRDGAGNEVERRIGRARRLGRQGYRQRIEQKIQEIVEEYEGKLVEISHLRMFVRCECTV